VKAAGDISAIKAELASFAQSQLLEVDKLQLRVIPALLQLSVPRVYILSFQ